MKFCAFFVSTFKIMSLLFNIFKNNIQKREILACAIDFQTSGRFIFGIYFKTVSSIKLHSEIGSKTEQFTLKIGAIVWL